MSLESFSREKPGQKAAERRVVLVLRHWPLVVLVAVSVVLLTLLLRPESLTPGRASGWKLEAGIESGQPLTLEVDRSSFKYLLVGTTERLMRLRLGNDAWDEQGITGAPIFDLLSVQGRLYAASAGRLYYSDDGGNGWEDFTKLPPLEYRVLAVNPSAAQEIWAGASSGGLPLPVLFHTKDGGSTWFSVEVPGTSKDVTALAYTPKGDRVYAAFAARGLLVSRDGGKNWKDSGHGLPKDVAVTSLAVHPGRASTMLAGTAKYGVFSSHDGGATWQRTGGGVLGREVKDVVFDSATGLAYVLVASGGSGENGSRIFVSSDGGRTWSVVVSLDPSSGILRDLAVSDGDGKLYALGDNGVYGLKLDRADGSASR